MIAGAIVFAPFIFVKVILTPKYRSRFSKRLGFLLADDARKLAGKPRIWVHALSVGEVASAKRLVQEIRKAFPRAAIVFSAATSAGEQLARTVLTREVDLFLSFPLDLYWSVKRVVSLVDPDLFVLVETDFWPNFLAVLRKKAIPAVLVNGRISAESFARYRRLRWFFLPLFHSFSYLAMQTVRDAENMRMLGVAGERLAVLGNLKYDAVLPDVETRKGIERSSLQVPAQALILVAGSTHPGEEELLFAAFASLRTTLPRLFLIIAPRNVSRGQQLAAMAEDYGLQAFCRSQAAVGNESVLVLDTLGELASVYGICDVAFVGGSLVPERGHNPLEAAVFGKPVVYGPSMEDFAEVSRDLLAVGGARQVGDGEDLLAVLSLFFADAAMRQRVGEKAKELVAAQQGVTERHIALLSHVLQEGGKR
ncbi:3-deoxy-D-manno-octulosonic acid transferase [Thiovibrio sp. JS02]